MEAMSDVKAAERWRWWWSQVVVVVVVDDDDDDDDIGDDVERDTEILL